MSRIISPVQTVQELEFIKRSHSAVEILPLDLSTLLYCLKQKLPFVNPKEFSNNELHVEIIQNTDSVLSLLKIENQATAFEKEFIAVCRFFLHQLFFIKLILKRILQQEPSVKFMVSGFQKKIQFLYSDYNYQTSKIVKELYPENTIQIQDFVDNKIYENCYSFQFKKIHEVDIILHSFGYNFTRFSSVARKLNLKVGVLHFGKLSFKQGSKYIWRGVKPIVIERSTAETIYPEMLSWLDQIDGKEVGLLRTRILEVLTLLGQEYNKSLVIKNIVEFHRPRIVASYATRGPEGAILDVKDHKTKSLCIPHGTVTASRIHQDKSYRSTIAEAVFTGQTELLALQSKIAEEAYHDLSPEGKPLTSGNLILSERQLPPSNKKIILYAVTQKNFFGMQFYGVETYYEFFSNMMDLSAAQSKIDHPIFIKLHPAAKQLKTQLEELFPALRFTEGNLENLLAKSLVTISFSSTVIEDSLHSKVPIILFDPWIRYQHCLAESDVTKLNKAIYYVNCLKDLFTAIESVKDSNNPDFSEYVYPGKSMTNFKNLIQSLL